MKNDQVEFFGRTFSIQLKRKAKRYRIINLILKFLLTKWKKYNSPERLEKKASELNC